jgi:hypothetical protein
MAEDQYIILANVLDLPLLPLMRLATPQERMQHIVLSLDRVPFSLFVNVSPCHSGENMSQLDSWIPSRVTSDILTARSGLEVESGYLKLENYGEISVFQIPEYIPHPSTYCFLVQDGEDRRYKIEAAAAVDHCVAHGDEYSSTILMVQEAELGSDGQGIGASFYSSETLVDGIRREQGNPLVFCCSVRVSKMVITVTSNEETIPQDYAAQKLPWTSNIFIKYSTY